MTAIPNLFLAADYVQTVTDLATMEAANEAARRAVNGILEHSGSAAPRCRLWDLHEPELLEPWRANDRARYLQGLPWDDTGDEARALGTRGALLRDPGPRGVHRQRGQLRNDVEDLLSYLRTGESRSELLQRLTSGPGAPSGELLRAFAELARTTGSPASSLADPRCRRSRPRPRSAEPSGRAVRPPATYASSSPRRDRARSTRPRGRAAARAVPRRHLSSPARAASRPASHDATCTI